jgi:prefoldin subunit 5
VKGREKLKRPSIQTKELRPVARRLGQLAVARHRQDGTYRIRQRVQLRRALQEAGRELDWDVLASFGDAPIDDVAGDVRRLAIAGLKAIERDLEAEIQEKRQEIRQIKGTVKALSKLAEAADSVFPVEIEYKYTSSSGKDEYVTKTEELEVESRDSAEQAALRLEKQMDRLGRLRDEMVAGLRRKQQTVSQAKSELGEFVHGTRPLVREVLAVLH